MSDTAESLSPETTAVMEAVFGAPEEHANDVHEEPKTEPKEPANTNDKTPDEPANDVAAKPKDERTAARIAAAMRAESRAAKQREEIASQRADIERQHAELKAATEAAEAFKAAKTSPSKALELLGVSPKQFLESLATENDPSSVAKRETSRAMTEVETLRSEVEALRKEREAERQQRAAREHEAATLATQEAFVNFVAESYERYPHLCEELTPEEIGAEALRVAMRYASTYKAETGEDFTDDVLADYLESQAKERAERRAAFRARFRPAQAGDHGQKQETAQPDKSQNPRTLTSRIAAAKASPPRDMTPEEADRQSRAIFEAALRA